MCVSNNSEYNQLVIENVLEGSGFVMEVKCPSCGKQASENHYDRNDGGCINSYFRIDCLHCNHHECDDDFCNVCEASLESLHAYSEAYGKYDLMLEFIFDESNVVKPRSPVEITNAKLYFINEVKAVCGSDCDHLFNKYVQFYLERRAALKEIEIEAKKGA